ncbi:MULTISPECIES: cobalt ECF transporter T component CbiQ [Anoxybacillaceae]|uniref:Cobalt ECF transporter T component CbiQ n=1 Tax=Anoxybacteroides rupiense TaxID=311460 RepID=A0ABD5IV63_9BACL|nr:MULTISPECIES: cobalt ECF transporter T component CbiQ [Anoxybacillus]MED5051559.1 cobalt ECF transporter T component CbiQ [Anoxybacillus rupiensis]OQM45826.1 cobalt ECF transporter T component CbiQ [Anoxybacillus sp. UARK-01]
MIRHFDMIAYHNRLRRLRPEQKTLFSFLLLLNTMVGSRGTHLFIIFWLAIWTIGYAGVSWKVYVKTLGMVILFLLISWPILLISLDSWHISVNRGNIPAAIDVSLRSIAAWSCLFFLLVTTPFPELLYVLKKLKIPSVMIELLFFMYRFIFVFEQAAEELYTAMKARNGGSHWRHGAMLIFQLWQKVWGAYHALLLALRARGFSDELVYIQNETGGVWSKRYIVEAIAGMGVLIWMR